MSDRIYCDLDDVKRLLRSVGVRESKVRFSSAYKELKADSGNAGTIVLSGVTFESCFADHEMYTFTFTDSTSFSVVGDVVGSLGSGTVRAKFTSTDRFSVPLANWSGSANAGDKWYITANSDVSDDDGDDFIDDVCGKINSSLEARYGSLASVPFIADLSVTIPDAIKYACIRLSAYEIFNSVFAGIGEGDSPVAHWRDDAEKALNGYLDSHGKGPIWRSREIMITKIGITGVGEGVVDIDELTGDEAKDYSR